MLSFLPLTLPAIDLIEVFVAQMTAISRPMKRLAVLATQTLSATSLTTATKLFGADNVEALVVPE